MLFECLCTWNFGSSTAEDGSGGTAGGGGSSSSSKGYNPGGGGGGEESCCSRIPSWQCDNGQGDIMTRIPKRRALITREIPQNYLIK